MLLEFTEYVPRLDQLSKGIVTETGWNQISSILVGWRVEVY